MRKAKLLNKEQTKKIEVSETYSVKSMLKILLILSLIFGVFYGVTILLVKDPMTNNNDSGVVVDSAKIILNQLLNRNEKEYYVIATKESLYESSYVETNYIQFYNNYINEYKQKDNSLTFYYIDLDNALNKKHFSNELVITEDISKLKLNDEILFKINNGKIEKTYVGKDKILDKLSRL